MKNLLIILSLTLVFACHTKEEQAKSGINDPINIIYNNIDSSMMSINAAPAPAPDAPDTASGDGCIDSTKIQPDAMCTQEFAPVCGCNGKEYPNKCEADKAGVTKYTDGPCAKKEEKKTSQKTTTKTSQTTSQKDSKKDKKKKKK
jgi:hypothetical protein